jgi:preprotein translocase subunit SecE
VAQDNAPNKPVHLMFFVGGLLLFYVLQWTIDWIWGYFVRTPDEIYVTVFSAVAALTVGILMYRNDRVHTMATEVAAELKKVTWPTAKEVRAATIVVLVMSVVAAAILSSFDFVWANLTQLIYG